MLTVKLQQLSPIPLDVEMGCNKGEVLALVGPSGAGKSTVLRCIAGLHMPESGMIVSNNQTWFSSQENIKQTPQQRRVGMVFQSYALFPHLTVADNIRLALNKQLTANEKNDKIDYHLEQVNLKGLAHRYPYQLSGGQQQRVALARALARSPDVLLLDEPFSAVDKVTRRKLYMELNTLRRKLEMPIILVTHDLDEAAMLADTICVIHEGKTLQQGSPDEIFLHPENTAVARQVDVRNLLSGQLVEHDGELKLNWHDYHFSIAHSEGFVADQAVSWMLSPAKILLHQRVRASRGEQENPVTGHILDSVTLRGITTLIIEIDNADGSRLQMDLPHHVALRNQLIIGETITMSLLAEDIHLMAD